MAETMAIDMNVLCICYFQGDIFRAYFDQDYDMEAFTRWYLNLDPNRPDWSTVEALPRRSNDAGYDADTAEWIGFSYSYLELRTGKRGDELLRLAPFAWILKAYAKLSCVVEERAVEILMGMLTTRGALKSS